MASAAVERQGTARKRTFAGSPGDRAGNDRGGRKAVIALSVGWSLGDGALPPSVEAILAVRRVRLNRHHELAGWAADCAERVLALFEAERPADARPRHAIEAARRWQGDDLTVVEARKLAFASHAAARQSASPAAVAAARAAAHAAATAHVAAHAPHAASYARKAIEAAGYDAEAEHRWQIDRLPHLPQ
ncbi:putative immunity protein [Allosphingosinicella deserti]|uniref:putative immunity protein n=1 Tax=Allosphingosinicella deserti TaxID=2116704 RepID=UPI0038CD5FC3